MVKVERGPPSGGLKPPPRAPMPSKSGSTQKMAANIKVVVRVRPLNEKEKELNNRVVVDVVDERMLVFDPKEEIRPFFYQGVQQPNKNFLKRANKELKFVFDHICDTNATNNIVFETTTKDMLSALMEGYNCSVFAYGATGAGKTYTMIGNSEHPGITYLTMEYLFYTINSFEHERDFDIAVSYIEVYNENVYDLLKPSCTPLQLREDTKYGVMVAGLTLNSIKTARELLNMLEDGNKNRTQHPTDANSESSRSHAVFQVYVKMRYKTSSKLRLVKLSMIDLAGSERASATGCVGDRFKEGANINKSLLSLGNCINGLADGSNYIPYRDSKLTRLLKDSLGGNCKTVMIANISPSSVSYEDTYNTLKYATRANKIQLSIKKNIVDGGMRMSQYVQINEELKKKVKELEAKLSLSNVKQVAKETDFAKEKAKQEWRRRLSQEEEVLSGLQNQLLSLMSRQRVLALRQRLRTSAFAHVMDLAHRSSTEAMEQMCTEDIPRQERAIDNSTKQSIHLDAQVVTAWTKWDECRKKFDVTCQKALSEVPDLADLIKTKELQSELRLYKARDELRHKLLAIENEEISMFTGSMSDMTGLLKKLYLTLKGYDKAPPALAEEYLDVMKKAKSAKGVTWCDENTESDAHFNFISNLELDKPSTTAMFGYTDKENINSTIILSDSEDLTDAGSDAQSIPPAKKLKPDFAIAPEEENYGSIDPDELNSTFVLARKMVSSQKSSNKPVENGLQNGMPKRHLVDRTNTMARDQKTISFGDKARIAKPVVGKAFPQRRAPAGFGSSLSRDGTPFARNTVQDSYRNKARDARNISVGFKAVRARDRPQHHPYSRPPPLNSRN